MKHSTTTCHALLVLLAGFVMQMIGGGTTYSYGVFLANFNTQYNVTESEAAWAGALEAFMVASTGLFCLPIMDFLGWQASTFVGIILSVIGLVSTSFVKSFELIYLTYGIFTGIGLGFMYCLPLFVVQNYFEEDLVMACAIVVSGFEVGLMSFGPLIQLIINYTSWRWAMRSLAMISCLAFIGVIAFRPIQPSANRKEQDDNSISVDEDKSDDSCCSSSKPGQSNDIFSEQQLNLGTRFVTSISFYGRLDFIMFSLGFLCLAWSFICPYSYIPLRAQAHGISPKKSSLLLTIFGVSGIAIRLFLLLGRLKIKTLVLSTALAMFISGFVSLLVPFCTTFYALSLYSSALGIAIGYVLSTYYAVVAELLGKADKEKSTAGLIAWSAIADLISSPVGGWLIVATGSLDLPFLFSGAVGIFGCVFYAIALMITRKNWHDMSEEEKPIL